MKQDFTGKLCFLLLVVFFSSGAYGQPNVYFDHTPLWQMNRQCAEPFPCIVFEDYNYFINGDSIVGGYTYKKVFRKGLGYYSWLNPPPVPGSCSGSFQNPPAYWGALVRSDNQKIFIRQDSDTIEYLLYDFNLSIGDTLPLTYNNFQNDIVITAIDSISTAFGFRKRFFFSPNSLWATEMVEGIGHNRGFLEPVSVPLECGYELTCFSLEDSSYYPINGLICDLIVSDNENEIPDKSPQVNPTIFTESAVISWPGPILDAQLKVFNAQGKLIRQQNKISGTSFLFERKQMTAGIYFFEIRDAEKKSLTGKLIIAR